MIPELETLYNQAINTDNLTRWLRDGDIVKYYEDSVGYAEKEQAQLLSTLTGDVLKQFSRYIENRAAQEGLEQLMMFSQGLSMGIRLGSLCAWS